MLVANNDDDDIAVAGDDVDYGPKIAGQVVAGADGGRGTRTFWRRKDDEKENR